MYNMLEPSTGLEHIIIEAMKKSSLTRCDAIEFNIDMYDILERQSHISKLYNRDAHI